jgi:phage shock protein PspC (stress-responsive transcriptional regulator)
MESELYETQPVLLGVCAALARRAALDPLAVRAAALVLAIYLAPILVPAYIVIGLTTKSAADA